MTPRGCWTPTATGCCGPRRWPGPRSATAAAIDEGALNSRCRRPAPAHADLGRRPGCRRDRGTMLAAAFGGSAGEPMVVAAESPPWIGPLDVLVVAGDDPGDPTLVTAAATAVRRRARVVVAAPYEGPAARCHRQAHRGAGAAAAGARRVRAVPLSGRRAALAAVDPGSASISPGWPTNSTPRRCATARAASCSPTRQRFWPNGSPGAAGAGRRLRRDPGAGPHGAAVFLRLAGGWSPRPVWPTRWSPCTAG